MTTTNTDGAWGSCPECKAAITQAMAFCKGCGFPLKPVQQSPAAAPVPPAKKPIGRLRRPGKPG